MIQRIIIIFSKYTARTDIDRNSKKIPPPKKNDCNLEPRGALPYMFTISAAKNIFRYSKDFVRGSLKPRFHSSVINWSIHAWTYTVDAQKLSHSFFQNGVLGWKGFQW